MGGSEARENRKDSQGRNSNVHGSNSSNHSGGKQFVEYHRTFDLRYSARGAAGQHKGISKDSIEHWRYAYAKRIVPISAILTGIVLLITYVLAWYELVNR